MEQRSLLMIIATRQWSRAVPAGPRPSGRYGHSLNILGSKIYVFGGQVEGYFMNDLVAFDLNQLQVPTNRWEMLIRNSDEGGPPVGQIPPARTNHSVVTYNEKLYLYVLPKCQGLWLMNADLEEQMAYNGSTMFGAMIPFLIPGHHSIVLGIFPPLEKVMQLPLSTM
jgi:hypothetical protein